MRAIAEVMLPAVLQASSCHRDETASRVIYYGNDVSPADILEMLDTLEMTDDLEMVE